MVSVIIPVYKTEKYLETALNSVINQTYKDVEIILVDDGSPDNCPQLCDEFSERYDCVKVIHKENGGLSSARNAGIEKATGDYLCFVDGDDYLEQDYFSKANIILEKSHPKLLVNTYKIENKDNDCYLCHRIKKQSLFNKKQYICSY